MEVAELLALQPGCGGVKATCETAAQISMLEAAHLSEPGFIDLRVTSKPGDLYVCSFGVRCGQLSPLNNN